MHRALTVLLLAVVVLVSVEILGFVAGKIVARAGFLYDPPSVEDYPSYLARRDPLVGWPAQASFGQGEFDRSGSRVVPEFPDPSVPACAALFGDSFTWSADVPPEHAYGNVLARLMKCRVANYGVGGYGTDQALLRYEKLITDPAPIVILGHYSENIIRNINQERGFLGNQVLGLKPRFIAQNGELKLVPLPELSEAEYRSLATRARELLPYDYFAPGGPSGIGRLEFPYSLSTLGVVRHYRIMARLQGRPSYAQFYDPGHPSQALQVTESIIRAFVAEAGKRGQKAMVLIIPDQKDMEALRRRGELPYAVLVNRLRIAGIETPDVAEAMAPNSDCELYMRCDGGHFSARGYARLAEIAFDALVTRGWVKPWEFHRAGAVHPATD